MQESKRDKIVQNLQACSCSEEIIEKFMSNLDAGRSQEALRLLATQRQRLLDQFHRCNTCIGCLDYLVHQIENESE